MNTHTHTHSHTQRAIAREKKWAVEDAREERDGEAFEQEVDPEFLITPRIPQKSEL